MASGLGSTIAIWRERGTYHLLCGEFALQAKLKRPNDFYEGEMVGQPPQS